jgi:RNA polymerase sigma factor (sigma-70 family)
MHPPIERLSHGYPSENAFIAAFHAGARDTFQYVYKEMCPSITRYLENLVCNIHDANDICSAVFLKLYEHRQKIKSFQHIRRWLYVSAYNAAVNLFREKKRETLIKEQLGYLASDSESSLADLADFRRRLLKYVITEINRLPRQRKAVFRLYFIERRTTAEIATRLRLRPQTVLNHKTEAITALRRTLLPALDEL